MKKSTLNLLLVLVFLMGCSQKSNEDRQGQSKKIKIILSFVKQGKIKDIKKELNNGFDINSKVGLSTLLIVATQKQNIELVKFLLKNNADPNLKNSLGDTALMYAAKKGNLDIIKLLCEKGADVNITNNDGENALFGASGFGHITTVKYLLENGANAKTKTKDNYTILMSAELYPNIIALLIKKTPDINAKFEGDTVLIRSTSQGTYKTVKILLENHAKPNIKDKNGLTALDHAIIKCDKKLIKLLRKHGAKTAKELQAEHTTTPPTPRR